MFNFKPKFVSENRFLVTVDYSMPLASMIATGKYDEIDETIEKVKFFTPSGKGIIETEIMLARFDRDFNIDDAMAVLCESGLAGARLEHACSLGTSYPELQRDFPILFLGSTWGGCGAGPHAPCLTGSFTGRRLCLTHLRHPGKMSKDYRFAIVARAITAQ